MLKVASNPIDVQDFQFKLHCRLKIFDSTEGNPIKNVSNLIASASRFGLLFTGCNSSKLKVIRYASIEDYSSTSNSVVNYLRRDIILPSVPQHINVNCDHTILSVIVERENCPIVLFYDVKSFVSQNVILLNEVRLSSTAGVQILEASWHPTVSTIFTDCKTDGTLGVYELKGNSVDINKLPAESNASCFCWSPKGKQIAVGSKDGKLTHYKPDLKAVKVINAPPLEKPNVMISVQWISTYQFIGIFKPSDASEDQCSIIVIDAPKTGNPTFTNFYDICYSNGNLRAPQFYMIFEQHWNILVVASSNSMEVGVLALTGDSWVQWTLSDSARAELPLDENREETYPVGIAIDTSSVKPVPWGESSLQPVPSLLILSNQGILCCFKIINLKESVPGINSPPENFADLSGLGTFTTGAGNVSKPAIEVLKVVPHNNQPSLMQNIQQQIVSKEIQKESKPIQSAFGITPVAKSDNKTLMQTPHLSFQTLETKSAQKAHLSNEPQSVHNVPVTNLFGGQVTITHTNNKGLSSKSVTSAKGSMLLSNLNTMNPIPANYDVATSAILVTPKLTNQQHTPSTSAPQTQQYIVTPSTINQITSKHQSPPENDPSSIAFQSETPQENSEEIETILAEMVQMECSALEKELKIILFQGKNIRINLDPKTMDTIVDQTKDIDEFSVELVETSESQSSEIHVLKQNTVQTWAWLEEAKSRLNEYQNEELSTLSKSKPLDSVSEKHFHSLKQMEYYLDSQLSQAHKSLDEQWDKFQEYCRKINRVQLPTMEAIFQTMVKQNAILQKHDFILKYITSQMKGKKMNDSQGSLFNHLSKNKSLEDSFHNLKLEPEDVHQIYFQKIMNRVKTLPQNKLKHLRRVLQKREVPHVKVNSQVAKSVLQKTPEKKDTTIFVHMTPTTKLPVVVPKTLNFYQSTPFNIKSQIPSSALSAFASTNIGIAPGKSTFSKENIQTENKGVQPKLSNTFVKIPENSANTPSASNFGLDTVPKTFVLPANKDEEPKSIFHGQSVSSNLGENSFENKNSIAMSTPLLGGVLQSKTTISQSDEKLLYMSTKPTNLTVNIVEKSESSVVTSDFSRTTSNLKIEQTSTSSPSSGSSSAFTKLVPSLNTQSTTYPSTTTNLTKSTVSFSVPSTCSSSFPVKLVEKERDLSTDQSCSTSLPSTSAKSNLSCSIISVSTAAPTKPSFFTPITSGQLNISAPTTSEHLAVVTPSSSKPTAFTSLSSSQSPHNTLNIPMPSSTTNSFSTSIFGKTSTAGSNTSSTTLVSSSHESPFSVTAQHIVSTQSNPLRPSFKEPATEVSSSKISLFATTVGTEDKSGSISNSATSSSTGFSFLTGNQTSVSSTTASLQANSFSSASPAYFPIGGYPQIPFTNTSLFSNYSTSGTTASIFGPTTTTSKIFGSIPTTDPSIFGDTTTISSPIFSSTSSSSESTNTACSVSSSASTFSGFTRTTGSIFGGSTSGVTAASSGSLFGGTSVANTKSIFNTAVTDTQPVFGSNMPFSASPTFSTATTVSPVFGNTTLSKPFGNAVTASFGSVSSTTSPFNVSTSTSTSVFGESNSFGTPSTSSSFGTSPFVGNAVPTTPFALVSTSAPPFGPTTTSSSPFGNATSAASSLFGGTLTSSARPFAVTTSSTDSPFGKPSVFGQSSSFSSGFNTTPTTSASIFGQTTSGTSSVFGNSTTTFEGTTTSSAFGTAATPFGTTSSAAGTSLFEQTNSSLFGPSQNIFGGTVNSENLPSSSFGFGGLNVGTSTQSPFAKTTEAKSPFSGGTFSNTSSSGSLFGSSSFGGTSGGSIFGSSTFSNSPTFGNTPQQPGPFSGGTGSVSQAGFGTVSAFEKPTGFGVQPPFGGSPTFGAAPTFGGAPTFGNTSPFGNSNKIFGSASPTGVFGTNSQQSPGFGNLANQNTIGFGSLAQSANNPGQSTSFSGSSSFSSWR